MSECRECGPFTCGRCGRSWEEATDHPGSSFLIEPEETSMRWFGPECPTHQSPMSEVPVPEGQECAVCGFEIASGDQGWTIPHAGRAPVSARPYHHACMWVVLGLDQS